MENFSFIVGLLYLVKWWWFSSAMLVYQRVYTHIILIFFKTISKHITYVSMQQLPRCRTVGTLEMMGNTSPNYPPGNMFCIFSRQKFLAFYGPIILYPDVPWSKLGKKIPPTGDDSYRSMGTFLGWFIMVPNHPSQPILVLTPWWFAVPTILGHLYIKVGLWHWQIGYTMPSHG